MPEYKALTFRLEASHVDYNQSFAIVSSPVASRSMKVFARPFAIMGVFFVAFAVLPAYAEGLVAFYQVGGDKTQWVAWDTYVIHSNSLKVDGLLIRYKSFRIGTNGSEPPQEIKADCATRRRGQASGSDLYATYPGTIGGEEVSVACALVEKQGLFRK